MDGLITLQVSTRTTLFTELVQTLIIFYHPFIQAHIKSVNADLVGLQECQNAQGIADKSGYELLANSGGNTVLYNSNLLEAIANGEFNVPRDVSSSNDLIVSF